MKRALLSGIGIFLLLAAWVPAWGQPAPEMYTLDQIYYYLVEGTESSWGEYSLEPQSGVPGEAIPGYTKSLGDIYDDAEAKFRQCDAVPGQVRDTAVFFSTDTGNWGPKSGTIATRTLSAANETVQAGYYAATTLSAVDADLATANIKSGVTVFGVAGSYSGSGGGLLKTGQTTSYRSGDDGTYQKGTAFSYQTSLISGDLVTTDNVTGLMWASAGNAAGCNWGNQTNWNAAIDWAEGLTFAGYSDWRLPNRRELESIVDSSTYNPSINTTYFPNTVSSYYWSGSTGASNTSVAWYVDFVNGGVLGNVKSVTVYVRAVRGGE